MIRHENVGRVNEDGTVESLERLALDLIDSLGDDVSIKERCRGMYSKLFSPESAVKQIVAALNNGEACAK
jgi:hypothetical protein